MRLFDKCLTQLPSQDQQWFRRITTTNATVVLAADSIADYYYKSPQMEWDSGCYPYAKPPWDSVFVEWNGPRDILLEEGLREIPLAMQVGILFTRNPRGGHPKLIGSLQNNGVSASDIAGIGAADDLIVAQIFSWSGLGGTLSQAGAVIPMKGEGEVLNVIYLFAGQQDQEMVPALQMWMIIPFLAFTFANCSGVKLQDVTDEIAPAEKMRKRLRIPSVRRYTLNIQGHYQVPGRSANSPLAGVMPFHLCRGHFATYTPEKPMFGNPKLVGRYWHPPHMKGRKENGEIIKDYAITEPAGAL